MGRAAGTALPPTRMSLALGLVGLPNAGKSTLFNALTRGGATVASYPFTTIDPNLGHVPVPDPRLEALARVLRPERMVPATIRFIDIAGLVRGASKGEGLGNRFLAHIREVDAVVHVVRCFTAGDVAMVEGDLNPVRDAEIVETELAAADLESVARARAAAATRAKSGDAHAKEQVAALQRLEQGLATGTPARRLAVEEPAREIVRDLRLLTAKPVLYVANVGEGDLPAGGAHARALRALADRQGAGFVALAARLEAELGDLSEEDARAYLEAVGLREPGLPRLIQASYALLDLVSFFTVLSNEVRAWPAPRGTTAVEAAGKIHTDMQRGFVRAEVIGWEALVAEGSLQAAREHGAVRVEGRDYVVADGDVVTFRFAV
ncbi:MAG: redox-regulated ATPase YchF [Armatimonadota bacterium]|nr:redox-regulated ATPase YchF [Armatimonadota bacterium]